MYERIIPLMQGVFETVLNRQLESVSSMSSRRRNMESDEGNKDENNLQNRYSRSRQNLMEPGNESPYTYPDA